jgi:hypothetical protein
MSRFEEQFKNAFDHFEPEVDPKLWQQISASSFPLPHRFIPVLLLPEKVLSLSWVSKA